MFSIEPQEKDGELKGPITAYIHNVSPIKNSEKNTKWFDCQFQLEDKTVRGVCFDPTTALQEQYTKLSEKKSPVKITNFETGNKRKGFPPDVIIKKRTRIDELSHSLPFQRQKSSGSTQATIGSLKDLQPGQLLSVSGMVSNLTDSKVVKTKASRDISVRECQLTDPTGSVKLVMWDSFVDKVQEGKTYVFNNVRLKRDGVILSLVTSQSGCSIEQCNDFPNITPPSPLPSTKKTDCFEVIATTTVSSYKVCTNCSKKVVLDGSKSTVKCNFCNATMSTKKCPSHFYARVILKKNETKSTLSFFHSSLISLIRLFNEQNKESLSESDITEQQLEDVILSFDTINITYDFSTFKVIEVSH